MNYSTAFKNLVNLANEQSKEIYGSSYPQVAEENIEPNKFFIGYGNPEAEILILGKEKAFGKKNGKGIVYEDLKWLYIESVANPHFWHEAIQQGATFDVLGKQDPTTKKFHNVRRPYVERPKGGSTFNKYQSLLCKIYDESNEANNSFFNKCFISELNPKPSKTSPNPKDLTHRKEWITNPFYRSFKVILLACGNYLSPSEIEDWFKVKQFSAEYQKNYRFAVYKNDSKLVINTRQLSGAIKTEYLNKVANTVREHLEVK